MNWDNELLKIFDNPVFAAVKAPPKAVTSTDRLVDSFNQINDFVEQNGHLPQSDGDFKERGLEKRLQGILSDMKKCERCLPYDRLGILSKEEKSIDAELQAIFDNPIFESAEDTSALFDLPDYLIKKVDKSNAPDFVAQRRRCDDFENYEHGFKMVHAELKKGERTIIKFQESQLQEGTYFLVGGVMAFLEKIYDLKKDRNFKLDGRTRCIFENGTESNLLLRSLGKAIYLDGYTIQESSTKSEKYLEQQFIAQENDKSTGYIYILKSKSDNPQILEYKDLYKIGFTATSVEERIANAKNETTYLLADVEVVATFETLNLNPHYFEKMLHKLFSQVQLQTKFYDSSGAVIVPREWYIVPFPIIKAAIDNIIKGIPISYNVKERILEEHNPVKGLATFDTSKLKVLTLNIKDVYFQEIVKGYKKQEFREIKPTTINKYTYIDPKDGKRWLKHYDVIRFYVGYQRDRESALVEVLNIEFDRDANMIIYSLGQLLEKNNITK